MSRLGKFKKNKSDFMQKLKLHIINEMKVLYLDALSFYDNHIELTKNLIEQKKKKDPIYLLVND